MVEKARLNGKVGGAFGSYTHSGNAPEYIFDTMKQVRKDIIEHVIKHNRSKVYEHILNHPDNIIYDTYDFVDAPLWYGSVDCLDLLVRRGKKINNIPSVVYEKEDLKMLCYLYGRSDLNIHCCSNWLQIIRRCGSLQQIAVSRLSLAELKRMTDYEISPMLDQYLMSKFNKLYELGDMMMKAKTGVDVRTILAWLLVNPIAKGWYYLPCGKMVLDEQNVELNIDATIYMINLRHLSLRQYDLDSQTILHINALD